MLGRVSVGRAMAEAASARRVGTANFMAVVNILEDWCLEGGEERRSVETQGEI